jgi:predicted ATPase
VGDVIFGSSAVVVGIADLVGKSLVTLDKSNAAPCWYLLDTIRAYALEKLIQKGYPTRRVRQRVATLRRVFSWLVADGFPRSLGEIS